MASRKQKVTYLGPKDPREVATIYRLPQDGDDVVLTRGIPADVTGAQLKALEADEDHRFATGEVNVAASGAGAPWDDYDELNARDVVGRLADPELTPSAEFAAQVRDYEKAHEDRKTVVDAAEAQRVAYDPQSED